MHSVARTFRTRRDDISSYTYSRYDDDSIAGVQPPIHSRRYEQVHTHWVFNKIVDDRDGVRLFFTYLQQHWVTVQVSPAYWNEQLSTLSPKDKIIRIHEFLNQCLFEDVIFEDVTHFRITTRMGCPRLSQRHWSSQQPLASGQMEHQGSYTVEVDECRKHTNGRGRGSLYQTDERARQLREWFQEQPIVFVQPQ